MIHERIFFSNLDHETDKNGLDQIMIQSIFCKDEFVLYLKSLFSGFIHIKVFFVYFSSV